MTLSNDLLDVDFEYECPECSHSIVRKGSWFKVVASFKCEKCAAKVPIGYSDKLMIFEKHRSVERRFHGDPSKG
ncbi:hypothetical protein CN311_07245 [Mesorhizobium sanjuanii]|uniref:Uncharacterized protein n=1 Tax=Mesorhizobium sanjuanii TaxID=2037900 RepID=A0A2A6FJ39_9HYPH|nr:hypothetical protein CN311_07245 [Mesorhizobium sanjuanii]